MRSRGIMALIMSAAIFVMLIVFLRSGDANAATKTLTVNGGRGECAWTYKWYVNTGASHAFTYVEWTADPCNYRMQARGEFTAPIASHYIKYSGWIRSVGIKSQVSANGVFDSIDNAAEHIFYPTPRTYSKWHTYWSAP